MFPLAGTNGGPGSARGKSLIVRVSLIGRETLIAFEITGAGAEAVEGFRVPVPETPPACTAECDTAVSYLGVCAGAFAGQTTR
jgi:hypothetical protein